MAELALHHRPLQNFVTSRLPHSIFGVPVHHHPSTTSYPNHSQPDSGYHVQFIRITSPDELKKAYKKAAIKSHPDKGGDPEKAITTLKTRVLKVEDPDNQ